VHRAGPKLSKPRKRVAPKPGSSEQRFYCKAGQRHWGANALLHTGAGQRSSKSRAPALRQGRTEFHIFAASAAPLAPACTQTWVRTVGMQSWECRARDVAAKGERTCGATAMAMPFAHTHSSAQTAVAALSKREAVSRQSLSRRLCGGKSAPDVLAPFPTSTSTEPIAPADSHIGVGRHSCGLPTCTFLAAMHAHLDCCCFVCSRDVCGSTFSGLPRTIRSARP